MNKGNLKISQWSFDRLYEAIEPLDTPERRQQYLDGDFPRADRVRDLDMRYRWDLVWLARDLNKLEWGFFTHLYDAEGLNDKHIDSALKRVVPPLRSS